MDYNKLDIEDFDALVTGHLTHYAIWHEEKLSNIIVLFFVMKDESRKELFEKFFIKKTNFNIEKKIQLIRDIIEVIGSKIEIDKYNDVLKRLLEFKRKRNILAHGLLDQNNSTNSPLKISVYLDKGVVNKPTLEITPEIFEKLMEEGDAIIAELELISKKLN